MFQVHKTPRSDLNVSRNPLSPIRPNNFDLIRLAAAFQVVLVHAIEHLNLRDRLNGGSEGFWIILNSTPGVPIFFFISGFLISRSYERDSNIINYTLNRMLRIYPALWLCLFVSIASVLVTCPEILINARANEFFAWVAAQLTFVQFYNPAFLRTYGVGVLNGSLWTIPIELQFYFTLPILYSCFGLTLKRKNFLLIGTTFFFLTFAVIFHERADFFLTETAKKIVQVSMLPYFWMFLVGVLAQRNWYRINAYFEDRIWYWMASYFLIIALLHQLGFRVSGNNQNPFASLIMMGTVLSSAFSFKSISYRLLSGNDISYGIYIYHMVVINFLLDHGYHGQWWQLLVVLVFTIIFAFASWRLVEKRAISRKRSTAPSYAEKPFP